MKSDFSRFTGKIPPQVRELFTKSLVPPKEVLGGVLGVDVGSHAVKVVRREASKDGFKILGFAVENVVNKDYAQALSQALAKAGAQASEPAAIAVAGQGAVCRYIEIPFMSKSELESSMKFEVEKYVPFPLAEVASDYTVIQEMKDKAKMSILIAAAKTELIQKKTALAREAGLNIRVIDLDSLALANFASEIAIGKEKGACFGIINVGKTATNMNIIQDGLPQLTRDIFVGGDDFTKKIAEAMEMEYGEAERIKSEPSSGNGDLAEVCDAVLNNLAGEIRVSLDYFEARSNKVIEKIYAVGGSSRLTGFAQALNHLLTIEILKPDIGQKVTLANSVDQAAFQRETDVLAVALGLALR